MTTYYVMFCSSLSNIISELQITDKTDLALTAIIIFQDHPSINNFKSVFFLTYMNEREIETNMRGMNVHKTSVSIKDIPTRIIRTNAEYFYQFNLFAFYLWYGYC